MFWGIPWHSTNSHQQSYKNHGIPWLQVIFSQIIFGWLVGGFKHLDIFIYVPCHKKGMSSQPHSTPLVVSNMFFSIIYGIIPTPLTHIFQDGEIAPPTRIFSSLWMKFCNFLLLWWRHGPHFRWNHTILGQHGTSCWKSWKTPCLAKILGELPSIQKVTSKFQNIFTEIPSVFSKFPVASEKNRGPAQDPQHPVARGARCAGRCFATLLLWELGALGLGLLGRVWWLNQGIMNL